MPQREFFFTSLRLCARLEFFSRAEPAKHRLYWGGPMSEADEGLVRKAQKGDRAAFEELVRRTSRLVFARLYLGTGDRHRAEDLLQETWLCAYRSLGRLKDPTALRPWLLTIAHNVLAEAGRHQARLKRTPPARAGEQDLAKIASRRPTPQQDAERADMQRRLLAVLRSLPEDYRLPLTLRYITGADYDTIASQLGLSNGALRGLLHRGLKVLRARLEGRNGEPSI
jgi:RNA polymerase sigma-70 factor (ECF subfamily)